MSKNKLSSTECANMLLNSQTTQQKVTDHFSKFESQPKNPPEGQALPASTECANMLLNSQTTQQKVTDHFGNFESQSKNPPQVPALPASTNLANMSLNSQTTQQKVTDHFGKFESQPETPPQVQALPSSTNLANTFLRLLSQQKMGVQQEVRDFFGTSTQTFEEFKINYKFQGTFYNNFVDDLKNILGLTDDDYIHGYLSAEAIRGAQPDENTPGWNVWVNNIKSCASFFITLSIVDNAKLSGTADNIIAAEEDIINMIKVERNSNAAKALLSRIREEYSNTKTEKALKDIEKALEDRIQTLDKEIPGQELAEAAANPTTEFEEESSEAPSTSDKVANSAAVNVIVTSLNAGMFPMNISKHLSLEGYKSVLDSVSKNSIKVQDFIKATTIFIENRVSQEAVLDLLPAGYKEFVSEYLQVHPLTTSDQRLPDESELAISSDSEDDINVIGNTDSSNHSDSNF